MKRLSACFFVIVLLILPISSVMADTSMSDSAYFYDPLGDPNGWSFEGDPNGWTTNNGGYRTSSRYLDGNYSWYTSGGGDYYMWRYVDTSHALNAIKGKKVKFTFSFDPEVIITNGGFETGDLSSWETGGSGDHCCTWRDANSGGYSMLIGYNYTSPVADSRDWCYQTVTIPITAKNTIFSFWYHLFTEVGEDWTWFEVYIRDSSGNNLAQVIKKGGVDYPGLEEYGWEKVTYNLTSYAGQTIQIYFAVVNMYDTSYRTWCYVDDGAIENEARAEIYYEYTTGGGGRGCPYVSVWNGMQYFLDNNIMPRSESTVGDVVDYYLLQQPLVPDGEGLCGFMLSEFEEEHSFFDQVQLLAIDYPSNANVAVSPYGEILTYTNPYAAVSAITNDKNNVKSLLNAIDGDYYEGYNGSFITLNFGDVAISEGAKLVMRADWEEKWSIYVQVLNGTGAWYTVAVVVPRVHWATEIINLSTYLPDSKGNLKVRLCFTGSHKVDYVGLDTSPQATIDIQQAELVSAKHSKNRDPTVCNEPSESDVKSKLLYDDNAYAELMPHEKIELAFTLSEASEGLVRDFILVSTGRYCTLPPGTLIDPTVQGDWVQPVEYKWHTPYVVVDLPSTTTSVKAIIHGKSDFKAYVDVAIFTIADVKQMASDYGSLSVILDIYSWRVEQGAAYDGVVLAGISLAADAASGYYIYQTKLQAELLPTPGTSEAQHGSLNIPYAAQANNKGHEIDPTVVQHQNAWAQNAIALGVKIAVAATLAVIPIAGIPAIVKVLAGTVTTSGILYILPLIESVPQQREASYQAGTTTVWEQWTYPSYHSEVQPCPFVSLASGGFDLTWQFDRDSADAFKIMITGYVNWAESEYIPGHNGVDHWQLEPIEWESQYIYLTVYA